MPTLKVKRSTGSAAPNSLNFGELAFSEGSGQLYVGTQASPLLVGSRVAVNRQTLSGNLTLAASSATYQFLDPGGSDRAIALPASPPSGLAFGIKNIGTTGNLAVSGNTIYPGRAIALIYDGTTWQEV